MTQFSISILDTGPSLNFFSIGRADLLLGVLEHISADLAMPEDVIQEIRDKSSEDRRFTKSDAVLDHAMRESRIRELDSRSGQDPYLDQIVAALTGVSFERRQYRAKDQGETMVIAHAKAQMRQGQSVIALIDDLAGQETAARQGVRYIGTLQILRKAGRIGLIGTWGEMREIYTKMRPDNGSRAAPKDDGLPHVRSLEVKQILRDGVF